MSAVVGIPALLSTTAAKSPPAGQLDGSGDLVAYGLFALSGVILVAIVLQWVYLLVRRRRRTALSQVDGSSVCPDDVKANTELVVTLLRTAAPGPLLAYLDPESTHDGDLQRFLTILQHPYEDDLRDAASDGNVYLALARGHRATAALVADVEHLCRKMEELDRHAVTKDHVSIVATRTMISGVLLTCAVGGLVIAAVQVF